MERESSLMAIITNFISVYPCIVVFGRFLEVTRKLMSNSSPFISPVRYSELKLLAEDYQQAKAKLFEALERGGCGHWIEKPVEQDQFSL